MEWNWIRSLIRMISRVESITGSMKMWQISAADYIREKAPDLSWVYLEYTDEMGHRHGDSPQMDKAVGYADAQIGRIWQAIKYRMANYHEDWVIYITTDHGRDPKTGRNHGGQSDRERNTWIVTNARDLNLSKTQP